MSDAAYREGFSVKVGRVIDYIFGRNSLIGLASLMLLALSGYATWHGMRDFIVGVSSASAQPGDGMSISNDILVIGVVVALTFLMWLMLREAFGAKRKFSDRVITFFVYAFLALWSIGFGYGFWWSLISGEEATRTGLSGLQEDARDASTAVAARLDAVRAQLDNVVTWSDGQMAREETSGGSCGKASGAGRGPLYNARRSVRDSITSLRDGMVRSWLEPVQADVEQLRQSAASLAGGTVEERQKAFENKASEIRGKARSIAARSNELGKSTASEMRALAATLSVAPEKPGFSCYDPTLAQRLTQAADQAEQPAELKLREAVFSEGPAGVANAVKNLWRNIGAYTSGAIGKLTGGSAPTHTGEGEPITGRDLIALLATVGVDLGLLVLAILNPPPAESRRLSGVEERQIRAAINTAIARAPGEDTDIEWVRRHFIHHNKASYLVIPNLYSAGRRPNDNGAPPGIDSVEAQKALAMNQLAGVLTDLDLVRWPAKGRWWRLEKDELTRLKREEDQASGTDLTDIRKKWIEEKGKDNRTAEDERHLGSRPLRNHGLFSKAERALSVAGWGGEARRDLEIFRIVDVDGLTPLLMVLNENPQKADAAGGPREPLDGGHLQTVTAIGHDKT
ncbi:MAG: hypothetical protein ACT4N2_11400 [Hyphomicrobium sp.]